MPKILIADDNTNIQKMVALAFEERGIDVVSVGNGETAVRKLPDVNPDLVLADVFMPVRNGYEVCEFVKKDNRYAHVPVILLVGAFDPLDEKEARRVGADGVLKKPFVPPDPLIAMVMSALERNPRIAAELAKAKEVIPEPEPMPEVLENPAQKAPAPLPDFPEPTAEEAAQIYGFGKGVRTLDEVEEDSKDSSPKKPAAEEEDEEEFDDTSTRHDWRRRGMDLDIPDDISAQPAFSMEQETSPITFPSEKDVPPRRVRPREAQEEEPVELAKPHLELPLEPQAQSPAKSGHPSPAAPAALQVTESSAPAPEHVRPPSDTLSTFFAPLVSAGAASSPEPLSSTVAAPAVEEHAEPAREPHPAAVSSHWMDLMSPVPSSSQYGSGSWLDSLTAKPENSSPTATEHAAPEVASAAASEPEPSATADEPVSSESLAEPAIESGSAAPEVEPFEHIQHPEEPRAFGGDSGRGGFSYHLSSEEPAHHHDAHSSYEEASPEPAASEPEPIASSPAATHTDSFFAPEPEPVPARDDSHAPESAPADLSVAESTVAETVSQIFTSASQDAIERIPTAPPPNREALSGIPFLLPPREITGPVDVTPAAPGSAPVDVDAVVQKVIDKLGPQLQEMLAQGLLKPLVENLLQQELAKKEK